MKNKIYSNVLLTFSFLLFILTSCVDQDYSLKNNVSMDIKIGGDKLALPIGSTDSILLGNIIEESDLIILNDQQHYSINISDEIDPILIEIDEVRVSVENIQIDPIIVDFDSQTIDDFTLAEMSNSTDLNIPEITIEDQLTLPTIESHSSAVQHFDPPIVDAGLPIIKSFIIESTEIDCALNYDLSTNENVKTINTIYFGDKNIGQKLTFTLDLTELVNTIDIGTSEQKIQSFHIIFPEEFVLEKDENSACADAAVIQGSSFIISDCIIDNNLPIQAFSFFIKAINLNSSGNIEYKEKIRYAMDYELNGQSSGVPFNSLTIKVDVSTQLTFNDAEVITEDIVLSNIEPGSLNINTSITNLEDISEIGLVYFYPTSSLNIQVNNPQIPLWLIDGAMEIEFPAVIDFDLSQSNLNGNSFSNHTLRIPAENLFDTYIELVIKSFDLSGKVPLNETIVLDELLIYKATDLTLGSEIILTSNLEGLSDKSIEINIPATTMSVENAIITTDAIEATIEQSSTIDIREAIPDEVTALTGIGINESESTYLAFEFSFENFTTAVNELLFEKFTIHFPSFLKFSNEEVVDGVLTLDGQKDAFNPHEGFKKKLNITGFDFSDLNNGQGLKMVKSGNENMLIVDSNNEIVLKGDLKATESTISSSEMKNIKIIPSFSIDPLKVTTINGTLEPSIEPIDNSIELDLGESLDFLDDANLNFNNPQIIFAISNTVGIPIKLAINLSGQDNEGNTITGSEVSETIIKVKAAEEDGIANNSNFIISCLGSELEGYECIQVNDLSNLLSHLPDRISFKLDAHADVNEAHHVDLTKELAINASYDVIIPLQFDAIEINYTDTIVGLYEQLSGISDAINKIGLDIIMTVENSIPFELDVNLIPIDLDGKQLPGITSSVSDKIKAGNGSEASLNHIVVNFKSTDSSLKSLEGIILNISVKTNETVGGIPLCANQYVLLSNMAMLIDGGLVLDINEK